MSDTPSKFPQHDKLASVQEESQAIGEFLESMQEKGYVLGHHVKFEGYADEQFVPLRVPFEGLLAEHFGIDLSELEREKLAILKDLKDQHK